MMPGLNAHLEAQEFGDAVCDWVDEHGLDHYIDELRSDRLLDMSFEAWAADADLTTEAYIENEGH